MELESELKQNITRKFLKGLPKQVKSEIKDICLDLISGEHTVNITTRGKFTIAEIKYYRNGYTHHFLGVSAKNPNDVADMYYGIRVATEKALNNLVSKFFLEQFI